MNARLRQGVDTPLQQIKEKSRASHRPLVASPVAVPAGALGAPGAHAQTFDDASVKWATLASLAAVNEIRASVAG